MRVPLSWLRDFTPIATPADDEAGVRELARALDGLGLVTEAIEPVRAGLGGVVVARVLAIVPIEGADRIRLVHADRGDGEPLEIVCGATNFAPGDVVPLAPLGVTLPGGMTIERRRMRGVTSNGMLCSGRELGLGTDAEGLLILASPGAAGPLPAGIELGMALTEHLGLEDDVVFDLAIEPNRPDCLSVAGIARDLAARLRLPFEIATPTPAERGTPAAELASIAVAAPELCHGLVARVMTGLAPTASPPRVARRLVLAGMRPISAVVDATNYVMLELGQPTHAYDLDRLGGAGLRVRLARPGESLRTLDGVERALAGARPGAEASEADGLICDATDRPVGLAGVMGGSETETTKATTRIVLEVADFDPIVVGRTSARHGLRSEASVRFWRGTDPGGQHRAADRVLELVAAAAAAAGHLAPSVAPGTLEDRPVPIEHRRVRLRPARLNAVLGVDLRAGEVADYLAPIGFHARAHAGGLDVEVPTFRPDARLEVDLIEEVARHLGYERIAAAARRSPRVGLRSPTQTARRIVRAVLQGFSCDEAWTSSLVDPETERRAGVPEEPIVLENPVVAWESALRTHLLPGLLGALRHNAGHRNPGIRLFELGHVFSAGGPGAPPVEREHLGVLLAGAGDSVVTAHAVLEAIASALGLAASARVDQSATAGEAVLLGCHPTRSGLLRDEAGAAIGALGEVDPAVLSAFELEERSVGWLVLDVAGLLGLPRRDGLARAVSRFPSSDLDLAFVLDDGTPAAELERLLGEAAGDECEFVHLLDVYRSPLLGEGVRSLTYRLRFCALDHTLTDAELAERRTRAIAAVESRLPARLRA